MCFEAIQAEWNHERYDDIKNFVLKVYHCVTFVRIVEWLLPLQLVIAYLLWGAIEEVSHFGSFYRFPEEIYSYKLKAMLYCGALLQVLFAINVLAHRATYHRIGYGDNLLTRLSFHVFMIVCAFYLDKELLSQSTDIKNIFDDRPNKTELEIEIYSDENISAAKGPYASCLFISILLLIYAKVLICAVILDLALWFIKLKIRLLIYIHKYIKYRKLKKAADAKAKKEDEEEAAKAAKAAEEAEKEKLKEEAAKTGK